eukprot:scaffold125355_cov19-Tisochrysis_lutea.AAC.1
MGAIRDEVSVCALARRTMSRPPHCSRSDHSCCCAESIESVQEGTPQKLNKGLANGKLYIIELVNFLFMEFN